MDLEAEIEVEPHKSVGLFDVAHLLRRLRPSGADMRERESDLEEWCDGQPFWQALHGRLEVGKLLRIHVEVELEIQVLSLIEARRLACDESVYACETLLAIQDELEVLRCRCPHWRRASSPGLVSSIFRSWSARAPSHDAVQHHAG